MTPSELGIVISTSEMQIKTEGITPKNEMIHSMANRVMRLVNDVGGTIDGSIEDSRVIIQKNIDLLSNKPDLMTAKIKKFVKSSSKDIKRYMDEIGIKKDQLVSAPGEVLSQLFNIDTETARKMLDVFGIKVMPSFSYFGNSQAIFDRNATATEIIGSILYSQQQDKKKGHRANIPKAKTPQGGRAAQGSLRLTDRHEFELPKEVKYDTEEIEVEIPFIKKKVKIPVPKNLRAEGTTKVEIPSITVDKPRLEKPKISIPWKKFFIAGAAALGIFWLWYGPGGGGEKYLQPIVPTLTPTPVPFTPTPETIGSQFLRLTLPNYENSLTDFNFFDVRNEAIWNMTAYAVDNNHPIDTWMWSRKTEGSLDYFKKILGDNSVTDTDIKSFKSDPNKFINWLRMKELVEQAEFYQYRLTGKNGTSPSPEEFLNWAKNRFKNSPTPTPTPRSYRMMESTEMQARNAQFRSYRSNQLRRKS